MTTPPLQPLPMRRRAVFPSINRYKRQHVLGQGNFGKVCLAQSPHGSKYAIKEMHVKNAQQLHKDRAIWEVRVSSRAGNGHPFIINYKEATCHKGVVYIVMEYARGGNLQQLIKQYASHQGALPEDMVRKFFLQMCLAVKTLHDHRILHRDLKTENVFIDDAQNVKLGDFGLSRTMSSHGARAYTQAGTPGYVAPEILMGQAYDHKADIWSLGCILYEMCTARLPYSPQLNKQIIYYQHPPLNSNYSRELNSLLNKILNKNCHHRPSINDILNTPYMTRAFEEDLTAEQRMFFDDSFSFILAGVTTANDTEHADDIQRELIGSVRTINFDDESLDVDESTFTHDDDDDDHDHEQGMDITDTDIPSVSIGAHGVMDMEQSPAPVARESRVGSGGRIVANPHTAGKENTHAANNPARNAARTSLIGQCQKLEAQFAGLATAAAAAAATTTTTTTTTTSSAAALASTATDSAAAEPSITSLVEKDDAYDYSGGYSGGAVTYHTSGSAWAPASAGVYNYDPFAAANNPAISSAPAYGAPYTAAPSYGGVLFF